MLTEKEDRYLFGILEEGYFRSWKIGYELEKGSLQIKIRDRYSLVSTGKHMYIYFDALEMIHKRPNEAYSYYQKTLLRNELKADDKGML